MNKQTRPNRSVHVVLAVAVVLVLTALLGVRITAHDGIVGAVEPAPPVPPAPEVSPAIPAPPAAIAPPAPAAPGGTTEAPAVPAPEAPSVPPDPVAPVADVPAPPAPPVPELEAPCWGCPGNRNWSVRFRTDLDLLAPLGDGPSNAGMWFSLFTKQIGPRIDEWSAARERMIAYGGMEKVLPPDDPLLLEAEPWCDQATMRFYPDFFPMEGYETRVPNLILPLTLAKSWVARGNAAGDPADALVDYRRAIRIGRLLRQEDAVIITDLVGLACIRYGAEGIFELAVEQGDTELALVASLVLGEYAPQRLMTSDRVTGTDISPYATVSPSGEVALNLPDERFDLILDRAKNDLDRRFRGEAIVVLNFVVHYGTAEQKKRTRELLNDLASSSDPVDAQTAVWAREAPPDTGWLAPPPVK